MSETELRRTQLATPASDTGFMKRASNSDAEQVFFDLEGSVAPKKS